MKRLSRILILAVIAILFIAGSAIAVPMFFKPAPFSESAIMLIFGTGLIGMSVVVRKKFLKKN